MKNIAGAVLVALSGCGGDTSWIPLVGQSGAASSAPNVVVIAVDSLRRDALGCYGSVRAVTPAIDTFSASALRFDAAFSTSSWNVPAVGSMLTGRRPSGHGVESLRDRLPDSVPTIATVLQRAGYQTGAIVSEFRIGAARGYDQGFEYFGDELARGDDQTSTAEVTAAVRALLERFAEDERPFFCWVHYHDPHATWIDRDGWSLANPERSGLRGGEPLAELRVALENETEPLSGADREFLRELYAEEVAAVDQGVAELLEILDELDVADETLIVLLSTHGQEFFERGALGPATSLYQEQVAVPLIIKPPRSWGSPGQVMDVPISLGGLAATLAEVAHLPAAARRPFRLPSFAPALRGSGRSWQPVLFELEYAPPIESQTDPARSLEGASDGRFKLIRDRETGHIRLFDLSVDPGETRDVAELYPSSIESLSAVLHELEQ